MGSISRRDLIRAGAWSVPAGTVNQVFVYQQFANSVNWTWNATNTSGDTAQLTVALDLGSFTHAGWLGSAWSRSGNTYVSKAQVASGSQVGNCTVVLAAPSGTTGIVVATISAPGARSESYPFTITIP